MSDPDTLPIGEENPSPERSHPPIEDLLEHFSWRLATGDSPALQLPTESGIQSSSKQELYGICDKAMAARVEMERILDPDGGLRIIGERAVDVEERLLTDGVDYPQIVIQKRADILARRHNSQLRKDWFVAHVLGATKKRAEYQDIFDEHVLDGGKGATFDPGEQGSMDYVDEFLRRWAREHGFFIME